MFSALRPGGVISSHHITTPPNLSLVPLVQALYLKRYRLLLAMSPPITYPTAGTVWTVGETRTITWDVTTLNGAQPSNPQGKVFLGVLYANGTEWLDYGNPLVSGFPILGGNVSLTVPSVSAGENYIVCLLGSSGDISPPFAIVGANQ
ncbi:hypothetical protein C8Q70DRAFT_960681 [Cubamyces menziesii]|nr:hypothetical protein C8Q70DRAFT_960681 [Cubamyces menziesii]